MADFVDQFGRNITDNGDGTWSASGITISGLSQNDALNSFNGMAPEGWINTNNGDEQ